MGKRLTTDEFIHRATTLHNKYDYTNTQYVNNYTKVIITCPEHGEFKQEPKNHLKGQGCPKCNIDTRRKTTDDFIRECNNIHSVYKYDYSKVKYIDAHSKITIICPKHGEFQQTPASHLQNVGCPKCVGKNKTYDMLINEFNVLHAMSGYDYSKVIYTGAHSKITIICHKHGEFQQTPANHKSGKGCPICKESKGERIIRNWLFDNNISHIQQYSISECRHKQPLPFDFYIPARKLLIEFDGKQHFQPVDIFGGICGFQTRQIRDQIKTDYVNSINELSLLRIPYTEINNIVDILNVQLLGC